MDWLAFCITLAVTYIGLRVIDLRPQVARNIDLLFVWAGSISSCALFAYNHAYLDAIAVVQREFSGHVDLAIRATGLLAEGIVPEVVPMVCGAIAIVAAWRLSDRPRAQQSPALPATHADDQRPKDTNAD